MSAGLLSVYHKVWYLYHTVVLFFIHLELPHFVVPYSGLFWNILECIENESGGTSYPTGVHLVIQSFVPRLWGTSELHEFDIVRV